MTFSILTKGTHNGIQKETLQDLDQVINALKDAVSLSRDHGSSGRTGRVARTFKLIEGEPLETSYGRDLYKEIFKTTRPSLEGETSGR